MIEEVQMSLGDHSAKLHVPNERAQSQTVEAIKVNRDWLASKFRIRSLSFQINDHNGTLDIYFFADNLQHVTGFLRWIKTVARVAGEWQNADEETETYWTLLDDDGTGTNSVVWRDTLDAVRHYIEKGFA